jgi:hypothetical protein
MRALLIIASMSLLATVARAEAPTIHFSGYLRETGGFGLSAAGDTLWLASRITSIDGAGELPYDPATNEYTLVFVGLISQGEQINSGVSTIRYLPGRLEIYEDPSFNSDYLVLPLGNEPPTSFLDGALWLAGTLPEMGFTLWRDLGMGLFESDFFPDAGSAQPGFPALLTCGGTMVPTYVSTFVDAGYDIAMDGEVWQEYVPARAGSFGEIKALY